MRVNYLIQNDGSILLLLLNAFVHILQGYKNAFASRTGGVSAELPPGSPQTPDLGLPGRVISLLVYSEDSTRNAYETTDRSECEFGIRSRSCSAQQRVLSHGGWGHHWVCGQVPEREWLGFDLVGGYPSATRGTETHLRSNLPVGGAQ